MRIVTGYLPTPEGEVALRTAVDEARLRDAELLVVYSQRGDEKDEDFVEAREGLESLEGRLAEEGVDAEVHHLVRDLPPGEDLVEFARERGADLIVIGVRRRSPVGKLVLGSNAQQIVLHADCPVLCVKADDE
ncbi:MAG: universal stress protein [Actinobacteria bacterium]|nr:universal stress protein [Actinomycetota bacterium]